VHANLDAVLAEIPTHAGQGHVTSGTAERGHEGTTFELSCYTDPLGIEHVTGSLSEAIARAGRGELGEEVSLRFTTKFDDVAPLLALEHGRRTRVRVSVNAAGVAGRFEGGTAPVAARLAALRSLGLAGYRLGLTIAPVMPVPGWREEYGTLLDLAAELITHRFTPGSKEVLLQWYPGTKLEMDEEQRSEKRSKFGGVKFVYRRDEMAQLKAWFTTELGQRLPDARILYWT